MKDANKNKSQLIAELNELRQRVAQLTEIERQPGGDIQQDSDFTETEHRLDILSSVIEQSDESVAIIDKNGIVLYANPTFFRLNEYTPKAIIGQNWRSFLSSNASLREKYPEIRDTVLNQGKIWRGEVTDRLPGGEMVWREAKLFPIKNTNGEVSSTVYSSTDITNRKIMELVLRERESRYRLLIENTPTVAWISNVRGETIFISENVEKVYGFTSDEILAGGEALWFGRIHPQDQKRVRDAFELLFSTGRDFKVEYRIQRKDEQWIWIHDRASIVEEVDGQKYAYGVFSDISESKQAEQALQLYTDRLKILYQINQGILVAQSPGEIAQVAIRWIRKLIPCYRAGVSLIGPGPGYSPITVIALDVDGETDFTTGTSIQYSQLPITEDLIKQLSRGQIISQEQSPKDQMFKTLYMEGAHIYAFIPLLYEGELIGSLNLWWEEPHQLTSMEEDIAREVAAQLSISIRQTQLQEADKRRRQELELLEHVSTALRSADKLEDLYPILVKEFKALFSADAAAILRSHDDGHMECVFVYGSEEFKKQLCLDNNTIDEVSRLLFQGQMSFNIEHIFFSQTVSSTAFLPFQSRETILGGAVLFWRKHREFPEEECHLLNTVADVVGIALHRMKVLETLEQRIADRTRELSALYDVTAVSSRSLDLQEVLDQSLEKVLEAMMCDIGFIHLLDETGKTLRLASHQGINLDVVKDFVSLSSDFKLAKDVLEQKKAVLIPDIGSDPRAPDIARQTIRHPYAAVPLRIKELTLGVLTVIGRTGSSYSEEAISLLTSIADHIGIAIENARLYDQAQQLAVVAERQRLARDLHDSVTQSLYSLNLMAATGQRLLENNSDKERIAHTFDRLGATAHQALKEMRVLLYELRPTMLEKEGLVGALRQRLEAVEGKVGIKTQLLADPLPRLTPAVEEGLYHIAQEALNNALKHAESTQTDVVIRLNDDWMELKVCDDGKGFTLDEQENSHGMGLISMRERAKILGGELDITSQPGTGTCVSLRVKVAQ